MPSNQNAFAALTSLRDNKLTVLGVTVGKHTIEPGMHVPKAEAQDEPVVSFAGLNPAAKYIVVCLDLDAPHPSFPVLGPILHWAQPGLQAASSAEDAHVKDGLKPSQPFIANYAGPGPPPGSPPHRYCFFLYEQPESFDIKAHAPANGAQMGILPRMRYSLDKWGKAAQLGPIVAANYFVSN